MFRKKLIEEIEKYLSDEYIEETKPRLSLFLNYMKLSEDEDEDTFEDDYYEDKACDDSLISHHEEETAFRQERIDKPDISDKYLAIPDFLRAKSDVEKYIDDSLEEITFANKLNQYMYEKNITTSIIYQRCLVDRKLISKITTRKEYHPSKSTVFALCIGLHLSLQEGEEFLSLAGYGFNRSSKYDLIIKFMLESEIYDLEVINEMMIYFDQPCFE